MRFINLIVDGIEIPFDASHVINQKYTSIEASAIVEMSDGSAVKQTAWSGKTLIETSGTGRLPLPLSGVDYSAPVVLECVEPLTIRSASNSITLPSTRRSDVSSMGFAVVNGKAVHTSLSITGDTATLTAVAGAVSYEVLYWPKFTVLFLARPDEGGVSRSPNSRQWSFSARQV